MYNETQKLLYIEDYLKLSNVKHKENRRKSMINFFNRIQEPEVQLDKDFAMFNYEELKVALTVICRRSVQYQKSILSELRMYIEWCINNELSLDCENRLIGTTVADIDVIGLYKMNMFKDEAELNLALDKILAPMTEDTSNNILRAILHLIFNGVPYGDVFKIKSSHIDFENRIIHLSDRDINVSAICCDILKYVMNMNEFFEAPKFGSSSALLPSAQFKRNGRRYGIVKNGYAIENSKGNRASMGPTYKPVITKAFTTLKRARGDMITTTIGDVMESGIFSRIFEKERVTGELDFSEYFIIAKKDEENEYSMAASAKGVEAQYFGWKKSFGLSEDS